MSNLKNSSTVKEIIDIFKGNYNKPVKAFVWAKTIKEWGRMIIGSILIFLILLVVYFTKPGQHINTQGYTNDQGNLVSNLQGIVKFTSLLKNSVNKRQIIYADLMQTIDLYMNRDLNQDSIQTKVKTLSSELSICKNFRDILIKDILDFTDPLTNPKIASSYNKALNRKSALPKNQGFTLSAQSELEQWNLLCALCEQEIKKTNYELLQTLN